MGFHRQKYVKVSRRSTPQTSISLTGNSQTSSGINPSGNIDAQFLANLTYTLSSTCRARICNHLSSTFTTGTFRHLSEAPERCSGRSSHLTNTTTSGTGRWSTTHLGSSAVTGVASFKMGNFDFSFLAENSLLKVNLQVVAKIISLLRSPSSWTTTTRSTSPTKTTKKGLKEIGKATHISHIGHARCTPKPSLAKLVITATSLRIAKHLIGTTDLLETILCTRILIDIWVILTCKTAISPLQGIAISIFADP